MATPFDPDRCTVPPIVRIGPAPLLGDPTIPAPPEEIIDCLATLTPFVDDLGCIPVTVRGGSEATFPTRYASSSVGGLTLRIIPGPGCAYDFDLDLVLPCPPLRATRAVVTAMDYSSDSTGTVAVRVTPGPDCAYAFTLDLALASPGVLAVTEADGLTARAGLTLGSGFVDLFRLAKGTGALTPLASHVKVYNDALAAVGGDRLAQLLTVDGALVAVASAYRLSGEATVTILVRARCSPLSGGFPAGTTTIRLYDPAEVRVLDYVGRGGTAFSGPVPIPPRDGVGRIEISAAPDRLTTIDAPYTFALGLSTATYYLEALPGYYCLGSRWYPLPATLRFTCPVFGPVDLVWGGGLGKGFGPWYGELTVAAGGETRLLGFEFNNNPSSVEFNVRVHHILEPDYSDWVVAGAFPLVLSADPPTLGTGSLSVGIGGTYPAAAAGLPGILTE